ncbi:thioester domain-containing protein [Glycomyces sp. L485]|uniref:thioester domain-containing protein n=1 Tax=Glycomyces sp. L485 TaxID=2909235 RepID=UPI001F4A1A0C|nr:thioester domain-containing protein [Glycomyces sp. L485]MCH7229581.1 thioester domain-containing protein [Glycomyces sp. L485]
MRKALKGSLAVAASLALVLGVDGAALAQDEPAEDIASGTMSGGPGLDLNGQLDGEDKPANAYMHQLVVDNWPYTVYGVQVDVEPQKLDTYQERAWEDVPVEDLPLVLGVLANGYNGDWAADVLDAAGVLGSFVPSDEISIEEVAYAGTQAAIWHLADGWEIDAEDPTDDGDDVDRWVIAIMAYLLDNAEPIEEPNPDPHFAIDNAAAVTEGAKVGPFTVSTNFSPVSLTQPPVSLSQPEGATLVNLNGHAIDRFEDGQSVWVEFDGEETGPVTVIAETATWIAPVGRTFVPVGGADAEGQTLILASQISNRVATEIEFASPDEAASPASEATLPVTGSTLTMVVGIAAVLLAGGVLLVLKRRRAATAGGDWGENDK